MNISGLYVPLVTPFYNGKFDVASMTQLVKTLEPFADGFVPCLSSGEGKKLRDDVWCESVKTVRAATSKPVLAGILRSNFESTVALARAAQELQCDAAVIPTAFATDKENLAYFEQLSKVVALPILVYNTETQPIDQVETAAKLAKIPGILGLKDSSGNQEFFDGVVRQRALPILQGMENQLYASRNGDGFLISLANLEPELCREAYEKPSQKIDAGVMELFTRYNLDHTWFVTIKALLFARHIINSSEEVS